MIRMILLLVLVIGVTMAMFGTDDGAPVATPPAPQSSADADQPGLLTRVNTLIDDVATAAPTEDERVPLGDERRAVEIALAATLAPADPAPEAEVVPDSTTESASQAAETGPTPAAPETGTDMWYVTGTTVNLRGGPSTSDAVVGQVALGQRAEVIEETDDGWYRIRMPDGGPDGYIFGQFLSPNRPG